MLEIIDKINDIATEYSGILSVIGGVTVVSIITGIIKLIQHVRKKKKIKEKQREVEQQKIEIEYNKFKNYKSITVKLIEEFLYMHIKLLVVGNIW